MRPGPQVDYKAYVLEGKLGGGNGKYTADGFLTDEEYRWSNVQQVHWQGAPQTSFSTQEDRWGSGSDRFALPIH